MYKTADCLEDLDIRDELNAYDSVHTAVSPASMGCMEAEKEPADFHILLRDDSELEEIKTLLRDSGGYSAYVEVDTFRIN